MADLIVIKEDPLIGPEAIIKPVLAIRVKSPTELRQQFKEKTYTNKLDFPLTPEAGYERINIEKTIKPTQSKYLFEDYLLVVTLEITFAARNNLYKTDSGAPLYTVRWVLNVKIIKATASK